LPHVASVFVSLWPSGLPVACVRYFALVPVVPRAGRCLVRLPFSCSREPIRPYLWFSRVPCSGGFCVPLVNWRTIMALSPVFSAAVCRMHTQMNKVERFRLSANYTNERHQRRVLLKLWSTILRVTSPSYFRPTLWCVAHYRSVRRHH
jgi:hypothetical protein